LNKKQEMRQFTEFGVSLPDLLAEKYTKAEGRIVTAGDVIERVSKRMVSFNDVKDVLWQSTDKGGKFYGMQNVLAQSTSGMASNLKDAIDTMYYDIANSNSGVIKGAIKDITELVSHWRELTSVLTAGTAAYGLYWSKMAIYNRWVGLNNNSTIKSIMLQKQEEASILRKASKYRTLTSMESERLMMSKQLTLSDLKQLAADGALSSEQLIKLARTRQITAAQALEVSSLYGLNEAQMAYLRGLQTSGVAMSRWQKLMNTQFITRMRIGIKNLVSSIITLPNILMAAGAALMYFFVNNSQKQEQIAQDRLQFMKDMEDGAKTLKEFADSNPIDSIIKKGDTNEIGKAISAYKEQLQNSPIDMSSIITNADAIDNDVKKLEALRQAVIDLKNAKDAASNTGSILSGMMDKQDTVFSEPVKNNYEDMVKSFSNVSLNMSNITRGEISKTLDYLKSIPSLKNISSDFDSIKNSGDSVVEMMMRLGRMNEQTGGTIEALVEQSGNYKEVLSGIGDTRTYLDDANTFWSQIQQGLNDTAEAYRANGIDLKHTSQQNIDQYMVEANAFGQSIGLKGDDLVRYKLMVESKLDMRDTMKNHAQAWQLLFEEVKNQLIKSKTPIETASKENIIAAEKVAINNLRSGEFGAQLNSALNYISSNLNPIAIRLQIMGGNVNANTLYNDMAKRWRDKYGYMVNLPSYAMPTTEDLGQYRSDLKTNIENSKKNLDTFKKHYGEASRQYKDERERLDNYLAAQSLAGFGGDNSSSSTGGKKGHGGTNTDTFLKDMQNRLEQVKKAMDVYKKWKDTGLSESLSIEKMDASGIFAKGTFKNISSENGLNDWYKKTLENLSNAVKKAKYTAERKKYTDSIAELFGEFDQKATKDKFDDMGKQIEKTISDVVKKWDFYKKVKDTTGNEGLAAQLAFGGVLKNKNVLEDIKSRYGQNELAKKSGVSFETFIGMSDSQLDAKGLTSLKKLRDEYISEDDKLKQETVSNLLDLVQKNKDYAQQILDVRIKLAKDLADIEANRSDLTKSGVDVDKLKLTATKKANNEISKINFTKFKEDTDWATIFGDLDKVSNRTLSNMVIKLKEMSMSANMGVDEIKSIQEALKKIEDENLKRNPLNGFVNSLGEVKRWSSILKDINTNGQKDEAGNLSYTYKRDDLTKGVLKGQKVTQSQAENGLQGAYDNEIKSIKNVITGLQSFNDALNQVSNLFDKFGDSKMSDATGVLGSGLSGALNMGNAATGIGTLFGASQKVLGNLGPWGAAAGAAIGVIGGIADMHDKKLDRAIEKSKQKVKELDEAYKSIEDSLKYNLGNAAEGSLMDTSEVRRVKEAQSYINSMRNKGKLSIFDTILLQQAEKTLKESAATVKYLDETDKVNYLNAYNYQRNLYKEQLEELKKQKKAEQDKKKTDSSKVSDYNTQIEEMETKITQFSEDLANSLYGIDIKGWASQFGDALFEAWQKGESGAEAFNKTAASILQNLVKSWFKTNVIENAFKGLQKDLFGEDGQGGIFGTDNDLTQEDISKIASDIMSAQGDITSKMKKLGELDAELEKKGIDIKGNSSSSTTNAISGVSEQEANIIAAYMDAIRQDTYNNRMNIQKIVESSVKIESSPMMQAQLLQLQQIQSNTYRNMELVGDIKSLLTDFSLGNKKIYVN
jgi:hypothetical protein